MSTPKYCCYRHFSQGKHSASCTHCLTHVQLGVINPKHSPGKQIVPKQVPAMVINSKPFRIENRTHDYNQVQNKDSLPDRLNKPRLYVEKVLEKGSREKMVLPGKKSGSVQYQVLVKLYRKIGQSLPQKTKSCLLDKILTHSYQKNYFKPSQPKFLSKFEFIETILQCFKNFSHAEAEQFWQIGYNELRFKDKISIEAFVYNFGKFYLSFINYNNTFSEAALRQRMVDLRVLLFQWATNQVCFKLNFRNMRQEIQDIQQFLKLSQDEQLYYNFHTISQSSSLIHQKLRFLSQTLFSLTDKKFLPLKSLKTVLKQKIEQRTRKLSTSRQILHNFFEINDMSEDDKFAITDIVEFCKNQDYDQLKIGDIISWVQGVFDYIFYFRESNANDQFQKTGLGFNYQTRRIYCENILEIDAKLVQQFDRFLENRFDLQIDLCKNLIAVVEGAMDKMPVLEGHKKQLVQCNYLTETILRFIRQIDLSPLWWLLEVVQQSKYQKNLQKIKQILSTAPNEESLKKCLKFYFTLHQSSQSLGQVLSNNSTTSEKDQVQYSLTKFQRLKQEQLLLKLRETEEQKNKNKQRQFGAIQDLLEEQANREKTYANQCQFCHQDHIQKCTKILEKQKEDRNRDNGEFWVGGGGSYFSEVSKDANTTISTIQSLESKLFSLLNISL